MDADSPRWHEMTPSKFDHERAGLAHVRSLLPDHYPFEAWSNFTFVSKHGPVYEVDLLIATPAGLHLVELKHWGGTLTSPDGSWLFLENGRRRSRTNPLPLAKSKAEELKDRLVRQFQKRKLRGRVPFVTASVLLTNPDLRCEIDDSEKRLHLYSLNEARTGLPGIQDLIDRAPTGQVSNDFLRNAHKLLLGVGIKHSVAAEKVGAWRLKFPPYEIGPTWQDHHAWREDVDNDYRRVRIYPYEKDKSNEAKQRRESTKRAARREYEAVIGIDHPGLLCPQDFVDHEAGAALVIPQAEQSHRLDHYLAERWPELDLKTRVGMIRQVAEAVRYAHEHRLVHRALTPRAVIVEPTNGDSLRPHLRVGEWQAAARGVSGSDERKIAPTSHVAQHLHPDSAAYLAPEAEDHADGTVSVDMFGLGAISYLLLTGRAPAQDRIGLLSRLQTEQCLRPSSIVNGLLDELDELVAAATRANVVDRTDNADEFFIYLEMAEKELATETVIDPWDAEHGTVLDGDKTVVKRLGTGSSARALLVEDRSGYHLSVLKIGRDERSHDRLRDEGIELDGLRSKHIIGLRRGMFDLGGRYAIEIDYAGDETLAHRIRREGLQIDELQRFGDQLLDAAAELEARNVFHRDIKPDNIGIRRERKKADEIVLFDFSLSGVPRNDVEAGTRGYLDPFLGEDRRPAFDGHAERYAIAVTLHEMASTERPTWGDGGTNPRFDAECELKLSPELFESDYREALTRFFRRALHRDTAHRFSDIAEMKGAWQRVFSSAEEQLPATVSLSDSENVEQLRDEAAERVDRDTLLPNSGLTPRAIAAARRLGADNVGELLGLPFSSVTSARGLSQRTRNELTKRIKQWRELLTARTNAPERQGVAAEEATNGRVDLRDLAARLVPSATKKNTNKSVITRLVLGLHSEEGVLPSERWATQTKVAQLRGCSQPAVSNILRARCKEWAAEPGVGIVREHVIALLLDLNRVATAHELVTMLVPRYGVQGIEDREERLAYGYAALRAVVETEQTRENPRFTYRRRGDQVVVALEVDEDNEPIDMISAPRLYEMAWAIGEEARELAHADSLPTSTAVVRTLEERAQRATSYTVGEQRLVQLAAAVGGVLLNARQELYPKDMSLTKALWLARAGAGLPADGVDGKVIARRLDGRFPGLSHRLPRGSALCALLSEAGFDVKWNEQGKIVPPDATPPTYVRPSSGTATAGGPRGTASANVEERLNEVVQRGGMRLLTTGMREWGQARIHLGEVIEAPVVNVSSTFVATLRSVMHEVGITNPEIVSAADAAEPGTRDATNLNTLLKRVFAALERQWLGVPVLVLDSTTPLSRYAEGRKMLNRLGDAACYGTDGDGLRSLIILVASYEPEKRPAEPFITSSEQHVVLPRDWGTPSAMPA
ncbi:BREX system serine/threonine kinase PglW [Saccharopolyspora sp. K220]|uniref:BREX system serine/threonine kinase PglW n=1 Tax=Saccharopolyspora soli TaxID=2926618 RepID=UPI001F55D925|nr:BREX system serine/threonine kinase PglW [Saccharopolyspora soli]MCI2423455.1 BREX system serine/threonine kinase PglW [Saccharopolyspora soli]